MSLFTNLVTRRGRVIDEMGRTAALVNQGPGLPPLRRVPVVRLPR